MYTNVTTTKIFPIPSPIQHQIEQKLPVAVPTTSLSLPKNYAYALKNQPNSLTNYFDLQIMTKYINPEYIILDKIGQGVSSSVFRGIRKLDNLIVAIKII
jgi:hypothetical protein